MAVEENATTTMYISSESRRKRGKQCLICVYRVHDAEKEET